jgi:hypothetical protein
MIDELNPTGSAATGTLHSRGFAATAVPTTIPTALPSVVYPVIGHFWRGVIAGSLLVMALFVWSYLLMLGCHVGVNSNGYVELGWGAAVWTVITSCVVFFLGGGLADGVSRPLAINSNNLLRTSNSSRALLRGAAVWALVITLTLTLWGAFGGITGLSPQLYLPHIAVPENVTNPNIAGLAYPGVPFGFIWTAIITMVAGLIFSIIGSIAACTADKSLMP